MLYSKRFTTVDKRVVQEPPDCDNNILSLHKERRLVIFKDDKVSDQFPNINTDYNHEIIKVTVSKLMPSNVHQYVTRPSAGPSLLQTTIRESFQYGLCGKCPGLGRQVLASPQRGFNKWTHSDSERFFVSTVVKGVNYRCLTRHSWTVSRAKSWAIRTRNKLGSSLGQRLAVRIILAAMDHKVRSFPAKTVYKNRFMARKSRECNQRRSPQRLKTNSRNLSLETTLKAQIKDAIFDAKTRGELMKSLDIFKLNVAFGSWTLKQPSCRASAQKAKFSPWNRWENTLLESFSSSWGYCIVPIVG